MALVHAPFEQAQDLESWQEQRDWQLGYPSFRVATVLAGPGMGGRAAAQKLVSCSPRAAAELLLTLGCTLTVEAGVPQVWRAGSVLLDADLGGATVGPTADWEHRTAVCSEALSWEEGLRQGQALHSSFEGRVLGGWVEEPSAATVASPEMMVPKEVAEVPSHQMVVKTVRATLPDGFLRGPPGASGAGKLALPGPSAPLVALVLRSDTSLISESEMRRIASTLIDNVTLCASILTAEKIILGMTFDRPFLIHHMGTPCQVRSTSCPGMTWRGLRSSFEFSRRSSLKNIRRIFTTRSHRRPQVI